LTPNGKGFRRFRWVRLRHLAGSLKANFFVVTNFVPDLREVKSRFFCSYKTLGQLTENRREVSFVFTKE
jgi:hypothetical protein